MCPKHYPNLMTKSSKHLRGASSSAGWRQFSSQWVNGSTSSFVWKRFEYACPLFPRVGQGWKEIRGSQTKTLRRSIKKLASIFTSAGASRLSGWGLRDDDCCWLGKGYADRHAQWSECFMAGRGTRAL